MTAPTAFLRSDTGGLIPRSGEGYELTAGCALVRSARATLQAEQASLDQARLERAHRGLCGSSEARADLVHRKQVDADLAWEPGEEIGDRVRVLQPIIHSVDQRDLDEQRVALPRDLGERVAE